MKKTLVFILAASVICFASCKNRGNKAAEQSSKSLESQEEIITETIKSEAGVVLESLKKIKPAPFASATKDGVITLTEKEKLVKPNYLLDPAIEKNLLTFNQQYRGVAMYAVDLAIMNIYEMDATACKNAIANLLTKLGDEAFTTFAQTPWIDLEFAKEIFYDLAKDEYAAGREVYFWESMAASLVEQVYIMTRDLDKFMPMFTDQTAAEFTFNFVCLHDGIQTMVNSRPEMSDLQKVLDPLYVINAITVKEFRGQLESIKADIEAIRATILD